MAAEETPAFQALPYGDRWRITRFLAKGEAPHDPRMAAAAVELAESFQSRGRVYATFIRWLRSSLSSFAELQRSSSRWTETRGQQSSTR